MSASETPANSTGRASPPRVAVASFIGTSVEFYDFLIYGTAVSGVSEAVLPQDVTGVGVLSFATFGVGFFALGGMVFGHFGDRLGASGCWCIPYSGWASRPF